MQHRTSSFLDHLLLVYLRNPAGSEFHQRSYLDFAESTRHEPLSGPCGDPACSYCPPAERRVCGASWVHCSCEGCSSRYSKISSVVTMAVPRFPTTTPAEIFARCAAASRDAPAAIPAAKAASAVSPAPVTS